MKKVFFVFLLLIVAVVSYLVYSELSFSPLQQEDFGKIFKGYISRAEKSCSKNFLGFSSRGENFEIFLYKIKDAVIDSNFPAIKEWENKEITNETVICKWKNCPLPSQTMDLFRFAFTANNLDEEKCSSTFNKDILNGKNYYSFIYFNELEQYFLLYCTNRQELYYLRRNGF